jgi:hypothetical protein
MHGHTIPQMASASHVMWLGLVRGEAYLAGGTELITFLLVLSNQQKHSIVH